MSRAVEHFLSLLEDPALRERLGLDTNAGRTAAALSVERFVELGEKHGCTFTADELRAHFSATARSLSSEELERVSGGTGVIAANATLTVRLPGATKGAGYNELVLDDTAGKEK